MHSKQIYTDALFLKLPIKCTLGLWMLNSLSLFLVNKDFNYNVHVFFQFMASIAFLVVKY